MQELAATKGILGTQMRGHPSPLLSTSPTSCLTCDTPYTHTHPLTVAVSAALLFGCVLRHSGAHGPSVLGDQ